MATSRVKEILSWYGADNPGTLANLARLLNHGTLGGTGAFLYWKVLTGVSSYTVEYTTNLAGTITWQPLGSVTPPSNFMMDPTAATPGAPVRYYRVVGTLGPK